MLKTNFLGMKLKNPLMLTSGVLDLSADIMKRVYDAGAAAVISKGTGAEPKTGHPNPTILGMEHYMMNAVGLSNPGIDKFEEELKKVKEMGIPLICNIFSGDKEGFAAIAKKAESYGVDAVELNVSCPNLAPGEKAGMQIGQDPVLVEEITKHVKKNVSIPVIVKLTPNVNNIVPIAKAAEKGGADAISAINTVGPGMIINIEAGKPVLANKFGGISGPAIKPITVACVYKIYEAVKIPILGVGGVSNARDAIELMMAGASAIAIGSAVYYEGIEVFGKIAKDMEEWLKKNGYKDVKEIIGVAHG